MVKSTKMYEKNYYVYIRVLQRPFGTLAADTSQYVPQRPFCIDVLRGSFLPNTWSSCNRRGTGYQVRTESSLDTDLMAFFRKKIPIFV